MKKLLVSLSLLAMSFSGFAKDITEGDLQSYMKALPAVTSWASSQDALKNVDLGSNRRSNYSRARRACKYSPQYD
jgi:hypothetical protein